MSIFSLPPHFGVKSDSPSLCSPFFFFLNSSTYCLLLRLHAFVCIYTKCFVPCDSGDEDDEWEDTDEEVEFDSEGEFSGEEAAENDGSSREFLFMDEETKSRFTEYSLTSSVMRRNEQLSLLDDRFEKVNICFVLVTQRFCLCSFLKVFLLLQFYEQFDDDEIGALDNTEVEGFIQPDSSRLDEIIKDYFIQKEKE